MIERTPEDIDRFHADMQRIAKAKWAQQLERAAVTTQTGLAVTDDPIVLSPLLVLVAEALCEADATLTERQTS